MINAVLLKPLDGQPEGSEREFSKEDFEALKVMGAVRTAGTKAAPAVDNKMAPPVANKAAADVARTKRG